MPPVQLQTDVHQYYKGAVIKHRLEVRVANTLRSPDTLEVFLFDSTSAELGPYVPTELGPGRYIYNQQTSTADPTGTWLIRWVGEGNDADGVAERQYYLMATSFS